MSRSVKKGPFVEKRLIDRIIAMNNANEKKVVKTWSRSSTIFPDMVGPHDCRTRRKKAQSPYISRKIWLVANSASSLPRALSAATPATRKNKGP